MANHNSNDQQRGKYLQPVTVSQAIERMKASDNREEIFDSLRNELDETESNNLTDVVRNTIYHLAWWTDHDAEKVLRILKQYELYETWEGSKKEVKMFVEASKTERKGCYSRYPKESGESDDSDDNPNLDGSTFDLLDHENSNRSTPQDVSSTSAAQPKSDYDRKSRSIRRNLLGK